MVTPAGHCAIERRRLMRWVVSGAMILMGSGIAAIWTRDLVVGEKVDLTQGVFRARDQADGSLF